MSLAVLTVAVLTVAVLTLAVLAVAVRPVRDPSLVDDARPHAILHRMLRASR